MTAVPIHTVVTTPSSSTPPSPAVPATPHSPGSPQANPGVPDHHQQHPYQDSLEDIRADLNHYPGGLTEPDPADQQALVDAVPHNEDGTPERFPDPFGSWSQLQNDGGPSVPGRSNNCADCSRSFLETWYGNPQVSAPRTPDLDEDGNLDPWEPEDDANENQIRWTGAEHTYAGPGGDPETANNIASVLQQAGHGSAAIVQVDWPDDGGGHAFNVVNHNGNIIWIDTQSGEVSHEPLHIDDAEHVWHIPLDANRNPIDLTQSGTDDTTDSEHGTDTPDEGTDTSQQEANNSPAGNKAQKAPESAPSAETPDNAPSEDPGPTSTSDPERPDPLPATATRDTTPPGGVTDPTPAEQEALDNSVPRDENGDPTAPPEPPDGPWVQHVNGDGADAPGRNNNCVDVALSTVDTIAGNPTVAGARTPDLDANGNSSDRGEKAGRDRMENTLGARFSDLGNGRDAFNRLEDTLRNSGHGSQAVIITQDANGRAHAWNAVHHNGRVTYIDAQTGRTSPNPLHSGSNGVFAIPLDANRRPVAPDNNATGAPSSRPDREALGTPAGNRRAPEAPAGSEDKNKGNKGNEQNENKPKKPPKTKAEREAELAKAREIANTPLDSSGPEGHPGYGVVQQGDGSSVHHDMLGDESQNLLRITNDVEQTDLHAIAQHLHNWAEGNPSPLLQTIRYASENGRLTQNRLNELLGLDFQGMSPENKAATVAAIARLSSSFHEAHAVDDSGGADLHSRHPATSGRSQLEPAPLALRYAATQALADKDAQELAENSEALTESNQQKSEQEIRQERLKFNKLWNQHVGEAQLKRAIKQAESEGKPQDVIDAMREHRSMMRPDFSGKNFAALEVVETTDKGTEIHYIIDSSSPPLHSEPVLGEAFRRIDQEHPDRYEAPIMYTEFEPCGNRTFPTNANCADYVAHEFERPAGQELTKYHEKSEAQQAAIPEEKNKTKVVYGAGYRLGELSPDEKARIESLPPDQQEAEIERVRQQAVDARNADMHRFRGELARVWMKLAASVDVP